MSDIVERLQRYAFHSNDGNLRGPALEAAAEITRLNAELAEARKVPAEIVAWLEDGLESFFSSDVAEVADQIETRWVKSPKPPIL